MRKRLFRHWFIPKKVDDEYHHRTAKKLGLDWHYSIASVVQRNNVVQADKKDFEVAYDHLQTQLGVWGKVYPEAFAGKRTCLGQRLWLVHPGSERSSLPRRAGVLGSFGVVIVHGAGQWRKPNQNQ